MKASLKQEKIFGAAGMYDYVVRHNIIMHNEAIEAGKRAVGNWLGNRSDKRLLTVLDLACGGRPVTIAAVMTAFPNTSFAYTGIDIHPDQIQKLGQEFSFNKNVQIAALMVGNAWDLEEILPDNKFDIVFSGLNLHHGTPEELYCLMGNIHRLITPSGVFLNHDVYRPDGYGYVRRPAANPENPAESWRMLTGSRLSSVPLKYRMSSSVTIGNPGDWRLDFMRDEKKVFKKLGTDPAVVDEMMSHLFARDYSLTLAEMKQIMDDVGFQTEIDDYSGTNHPLRKYFGFVKGLKQSGQLRLKIKNK